MRIGFIGLGNMGKPMAENLASGSHSVSGYDISGEIPDAVVKCDSIAKCVNNADIVITMLPSGEILSAKVCQQGRKALMTNPNNAMADWMLRKVLSLLLITLKKVCILREMVTLKLIPLNFMTMFLNHLNLIKCHI